MKITINNPNSKEKLTKAIIKKLSERISQQWSKQKL